MTARDLRIPSHPKPVGGAIDRRSEKLDRHSVSCLEEAVQRMAHPRLATPGIRNDEEGVDRALGAIHSLA